MIVYNYRLNMMIENNLIEDIEELAAKCGEDRSKLIRKMLRYALKKQKDIKNLFSNE